jgi:hypothetical protein
MAQQYDIKAISTKIKNLRETATELKSMSGGMQAIDRNADRILANVTMLEMNVSDAVDIIEDK